MKTFTAKSICNEGNIVSASQSETKLQILFFFILEIVISTIPLQRYTTASNFRVQNNVPK